jgi:MYXO-CTERM domain-containing protein
MRSGLRAAPVLLALLAFFSVHGSVAADIINVVPTDPADTNYAKIESAVAGDEVVVAPGTYSFRVYLEGQGTAQDPIIIRAEDPNDRPVWDLDGDITANFPGSYGGGDRGRAIWQITGSHYYVSGIVFRNGSDGVGDGGGIRFKFSDQVTLHDCLFQFNDNGIQGAGTGTLVEFCEFDRNGLPGSPDGSHNLYIHGGTLTVRYCYIHDARRSQNMHIRANASVFEYNWITRSASYMGDMMPCTMDPCDTQHTMLLRGNVFVRGTPTNDGQVFVMYNDQGDPDVRFSFTMVNNTIIGNSDGAALVHFGNQNPALNQMQTAVLNNNVVYDVARIFRVDDPGLTNWSASGTHNWLSQGTADTNGLQNTVLGTDPGFTDLSQRNLLPTGSSPLVGAARSDLSDLPDKEYYRDETVTMQWRPRLTVLDIGAFESTTSGEPVGPYSTSDGGTGSDGGGPAADGGPPVSDGGGDGDGGTNGGSSSKGGCNCRSHPVPGGWGLWALVAILLLARRIRIPRPTRNRTTS